jgi:transglutaminase-like putative cysteine protease
MTASARPAMAAALLLAACSRQCPGPTSPPAATSSPAAAASPAATAPSPASAAPGPAATPNVLDLVRPAGPEWFGLYLVGRKAGFTRSEIRTETRGGRAVLVARQEAELSAELGPRTVKRSQEDEKVYEARPGGRLLEFRSRRSGDGGERTVLGRCGETECTVVVEGEGGREERTIPAPGETAEQADAARLAAALRGKVKGRQLEPEQLRVREVEDSYQERRSLGGAGVELSVSVVAEQEAADRAATEILVADDGRIVEQRLGAVVARAEPEDVARRLDKVDLFGLTRVKVPRELPRRVPLAIAYRLKGLPPSFRVGDSRQRFQALPGGEVLLTVTARTPAAADPGRDAPRARLGSGPLPELLAPSAETIGAVDSDAPAIRALAAQVAGDARGAYAAAVRINRFVHGRLEKTFGQSRDRASEVLASGKGDCTEHALLFTALARAAGVPARPVYGLVYTRYGDGQDALYWHAWVEVRSGEEWIALDPTFGQEVADATHLALGRSAQVDAVALLGALQVVAADPRPVGPRG